MAETVSSLPRQEAALQSIARRAAFSNAERFDLFEAHLCWPST